MYELPFGHHSCFGVSEDGGGEIRRWRWAATEWLSSCSFVDTRARIIAVVVLRCLARLVGLDLGQLRCDATLSLQCVIGILQPQEIAFRQVEELA